MRCLFVLDKTCGLYNGFCDRTLYVHDTAQFVPFFVFSFGMVLLSTLLLLLLLAIFMRGIYTNMLETNHVATEYSVAAVLYYSRCI
jgi:hypothetical protein